jgi:hypothetical protein
MPTNDAAIACCIWAAPTRLFHIGQREQSRFKVVVPFLSTLRPDREASISDGLGAEDASVTRNWNTKHPFDK